ncbi:hypothetical protein H3C67_01255 [Candidatus Dojkabacteria bacterium]|uniref:Uncharacterized protein n=2 Tax=Candidatus Dojkabacteria TaxID=74243 RepID=A0A952AGD3_9BACT|nr:hypothetical protein [Candidatus Dojkabacteria bacterium]
MNISKATILAFWKRRKLFIIGFFASVIPATYLMLLTLGYDKGSIILSQNIWSDFQGHIPLIRSFSQGNNILLESPTFSGELIRYHFGFYFVVALLELLGVRIDIAINALSIVGFAGLLALVYLGATKLSGKIVAGLIAVILILFNSSLSWYYYLSDSFLGLKSIGEIMGNKVFGSFGPYDDNIISAFWSLNVYIHQRHLAFAFVIFALAWILISLPHSSSKKLVALVLIALLSWVNIAVLAMLFVAISITIFSQYLHKQSWKKSLITLLLGILLSFPSLLLIMFSSTTSTSEGIRFLPGFIYYGTTWHEFAIEDKFLRWIVYWFMNLGLLPIISFFGFLILKPSLRSNIKNKKEAVFYFLKSIFASNRLPFLVAWAIFIIANIFVFARDPATNHKFINLVIIIWSVYAAAFIVKLLKGKTMVFGVLLILILTAGGFFDLWPIVNANKHTWKDIPASDTAIWIKNNTAPESVFLNITSDFNPVMSTGRRLYFGPEYINWSLGYNTLRRLAEMQVIISGGLDQDEMCSFVQRNKIDYVIMTSAPDTYLERNIDYEYFRNTFDLLFSNEIGYYFIYDAKSPCSI